MRSNSFCLGFLALFLLNACATTTPHLDDNRNPASTSDASLRVFERAAGNYASSSAKLDLNIRRGTALAYSQIEVEISDGMSSGWWKAYGYSFVGIGAKTIDRTTSLVFTGVNRKIVGASRFPQVMILIQTSDDFETIDYWVQEMSFEVLDVTKFDKDLTYPTVRFIGPSSNSRGLKKVRN